MNEYTNSGNVNGIPPLNSKPKEQSSDELSKIRESTIKSSESISPKEAEAIPNDGLSPTNPLERLEQANILEKALSGNKSGQLPESANFDDLDENLSKLNINELKDLLSGFGDKLTDPSPPLISTYEKDIQIIIKWVNSPEGQSCLKGKDLVTGEFVKFSRRHITDLSHSYHVSSDGQLKQQAHKTNGLGLLHHAKDDKAYIAAGGVKTVGAILDENGTITDVRSVVRTKDKSMIQNAIEATKNPEFKKCPSLLVGHYVTYVSEKTSEVKDVFMSSYMSGGDLDNKVFSFKEATNFSSQIATGLNVIHQEGWAHIDIKPANFFYMPDGKGGHVVKLADFDFAKNLKDADPNLKISEGTPGFLSPELTRGECFGLEGAQSNDIFSLGTSMLELVGFSLWYKYSDAVSSAGYTKAQILNGFHHFIANLQPGSSDHMWLEELFQNYKTQHAPLSKSDESYLNLAWSMIDPDPGKRPKIADVNLQLFMLDLGITG